MPADPADDYIPDALFENRPLGIHELYGIDFPVDLSYLRDFRTAWVLSLAFGFLGVDRFYLRRPFTGALKLLTAGGLGLWWLIDVIRILSGAATDGGGHPLTGTRRHRAAAWAVTAVLAGSVLTAAATIAVPPAVAFATDVHDRVSAFIDPPKPPPQPEWTIRALSSSVLPALPMKVTTGSVYLTWHLPAAAVVYLQPAAGGPGLELFIASRPGNGEKTFKVPPGTYTVVVAPSAPGWSVKAEELVLPGH